MMDYIIDFIFEKANLTQAIWFICVSLLVIGVMFFENWYQGWKKRLDNVEKRYFEKEDDV